MNRTVNRGRTRAKRGHAPSAHRPRLSRRTAAGAHSEKKQPSGRAKRSRSRTLSRLVRSAAARAAAVCVLRAALGFIISQGTFGGGHSPFGVAFAAAGSGDAAGIFGALGAAAGSFVRWRMSDSLRYMAAAILAAVAVYSAHGTALAAKIWFRPLCTAASLAIVGTVSLLGDGGGAGLLLCEIVLAGGAAFAYQHVISGLRGDEKFRDSRVPSGAAETAAAATVLLGLARFTLPGGFSPVRILSLLCSLFCGYAGSAGAGAAAGLALGAASGGGAGFCICCAFGGLAAGMSRGAGRMFATAAFMLSAAAAALIGGAQPVVLYETALSSVVFALVPERRLPELRIFSAPSSGGAERRALESLERRMDSISRACGELGVLISGAPRAADTGADRVFDRASARVCRRCALRTLCWERDRMNTCAVMRSLGTALAERGGVQPSDLPNGFASRCLHPELFLAAVNEEMRVWQLDRISSRRLERQRRAAGAECEAIAALARQEPERSLPAADIEFRLRRALKSGGGSDVYCEAWRAPNGRLFAEITGGELARFAADGGAALSRAAGVRFAAPELRRSPDGDRLLLRQREPRGCSVGVACRRRKGSPRSGDAGTWFRTEAGELVILLSDGMGSGGEAAGDSGTTVRLAERFLRAGAEPKSALMAVSGALLLRNEERAGFATSDLCILDTFSGEGKILKCGAAPTYIRSGGKTGKITGDKLPGGLSARPAVSETKLRLGGCDCVVMITDGVCDGTDDGWLSDLITVGGTDAKTLAAKIADAAWERGGGADDLTVVCVSIAPARRRDAGGPRSGGSDRDAV